MKTDLRFTPFYSLLSREVSRFLKVSFQTVITPMINASLYLLIFGISLGASIQIGSGVDYLAFLIPGLMMMSCLNNAFQNSSSSIISSKFGGDLEDIKVSPLSDQQLIWAYAIGGLIRGLVVGALTFAIGEIFFYVSRGALLPIHSCGLLFLFLILGSLMFSQLGISVAFWSKSFDQLSAITGFVLLPLIYLGGVFYSVESLHPFWRTISHVNPLLYLINGVRYGIIGTSDVELSLSIAVSVLGWIITYILALWCLKKGSYLRW